MSSLKLLLLLVITVGMSLTGFAQQNKKITGTVLDSTSSERLPGISVIVAGTKNGAQTDVNGNFSLTVSENATLIFRHVGYQQKTVKVGEAATIDVRLSSSEHDLDQVVVVAYGKQKKATVTGAIVSISTKEIKQSPAANLAVSLAGRLPGLTAMQRSGEPGRDITQLFVRGQGTINAQSPIVLVDGVERELTYIDPNEVESVTILKDASSTAIFGVRGANGVILVTTRRGTSEIPEINFSAEGGTQSFTRFITPVDAFEYATLRNQAQRNDGQGDAFSPEALEHFRLGDDPIRYPNTNWKDMLIKPASLQQRYNLNISGANKSLRYFVNAGYLNQGGQFKFEKGLPYDPSFKLDRYNFRSNIDLQINKSLKAFLNVAGYLEKQNMPLGVLNLVGRDEVANSSPALWVMAYMNYLNATVPPYTPDGQVITTITTDHPALGQLNRTGYAQQTRSNVTATYGMEQSLEFITPGLTARAVMSFDSKSTNNFYAGRDYERWEQVILRGVPGADGQDSVKYINHAQKNTPLTVSGSRFFTSFSDFQGSLNYVRGFGKHAVTGLLLYQQQKTIINESLPFNLIGSAARATYGYDNKYFAEFNAGYNGSEQFAKGRRFGFFPAVSAAWVISNEAFLANHRIINSLKIRGSYGTVGNDRIGGRRFLYIDDLQVGGGGASGSLGSGSTIVTSLLKNEMLQWEVSKKSNIGFEIGLFDQLSLTVDIYSEKRDNILRNRGKIPVLNGLPVSALPPVNIGVVKNHGYEIELNYRKRFNSNWSMLSKLNLNYTSNRQLYADEPLLPESYAYRFRETGYRIGQSFGYIVDGYFADQAEIDRSPVQRVGGHDSRPGDFRYKDLNGDGVVDAQDVAPIGYSAVPEFTFGGAFNVTYKNFDVSILVQGITNVTAYYGGAGTMSANYYVKRHLEAWTPERVAAGEKISYPRLTTEGSPNEIGNSFFIRDGSYIRLKNVELGYRFPMYLAKKIGAKGIRAYTNGFNLATWDRLPTRDIDPEVINETSYPIIKTINFGLNITF
ncbi:TonB-dependent receptor [Chitinophaga sp. MM2321]|uniref:SusC/RagA family TonB-linked outer membrane protein n=1 Tax=Chitinophaga sp. MM2321 TaxID=3137178 RepID=UPI0032D58F11